MSVGDTVHTTALIDYKTELDSVTSSIVETVSWQATQQHGTSSTDVMGEATHIASGAQHVVALEDSVEPDGAAAGTDDAMMLQLLHSLKGGAGAGNTLKVSEKAHDSYVGHLIAVAHTYQVTGKIGSATVQSRPVGIVLYPAAASAGAGDDGGGFVQTGGANIRRATERVIATKERDPAAWEGTLDIAEGDETSAAGPAGGDGGDGDGGGGGGGGGDDGGSDEQPKRRRSSATAITDPFDPEKWVPSKPLLRDTTVVSMDKALLGGTATLTKPDAKYKVETIAEEDRMPIKQYTNPVFDGGARHSLRTGGDAADVEDDGGAGAGAGLDGDADGAVFSGFAARDTVKAKRESMASVPTAKPVATTFKGAALAAVASSRLRKGSLDAAAGYASPALLIDQLLQDLRSTYDPLAAVSTFCSAAANSPALETLTAEQFAQVVQAVPFQLDQSTVAAKIAAGLKDRLSCAHVAAVLAGLVRGNPARIEIAKTLAALCFDFPAQRLLVDAQLSSFESALWDVFGGGTA